jgi:hypothetical protein
MVEHLPIVRFMTRGIRELLSPYVPVEDLYSTGVLGPLDASEDSIHQRKFYPAPMRNFVSAEPFLTAYGRSAGVSAS